MVRLPPRLRPLFPLVKPVFTWSTRALAPLLVLVSRVRGGYLPRRWAATMEEAAALGGGRCTVARPPERIVRVRPAGGRPATHPEFEDNLVEDIPRVAVVELPDGRVLGAHGAVITGNNILLHEISRYFGTTRAREHPLYLHPFPGPPLRVDERVGTLASRGDSNYYHFLMDVLPRIGVLEQAPGIAAPDRWYVAAQTRFQRELLDLMGIDEARRIDRIQHPHLSARCLIAPGPPTMYVVNPPWVVAYLREHLLPAGLERVPGRHIYVTRGATVNNRGVRNEDELIRQLGERGFAAVDPGAMSVREQIEAFAQASVIVAPHGAALANTVFMSPGAALVELFTAGGVVADYWKMAGGVPGLSYYYLDGAGRPVDLSRNRTHMLVNDIEVDLDALAELLDGITGDAG